jgi:hypothetical protein
VVTDDELEAAVEAVETKRHGLNLVDPAEADQGGVLGLSPMSAEAVRPGGGLSLPLWASHTEFLTLPWVDTSSSGLASP